MSDKEINIKIKGDSSSAVEATANTEAATKQLQESNEQASKSIVDGEKRRQAAIERTVGVHGQAIRRHGFLLGEVVKKFNDTEKKASSSWMTIFGGLSIHSAAVGLVKKVTSYFTKMASEFDSIGKAAGNLGVSTDYLQSLNFAAEHTNTEFSQIVNGFERIRSSAAKAASGNSAAIELFHNMGISIAEIRNMNPEQLFDRVTSAISGLNDPIMRDSVSMELFGHSFLKLNNFLSDYRQLSSQLKESGGLVSKDEIKAAEELADAWTDIKTAFTALVSKIGILRGLSWAAKGMKNILSNSSRTKSAGIDYGELSDAKVGWSGDYNFLTLLGGSKTAEWFHRTFSMDKGAFTTKQISPEELESARKTVRERQRRMQFDSASLVQQEKEAAEEEKLRAEMEKRREEAIKDNQIDLISYNYLKKNPRFMNYMQRIGANTYKRLNGGKEPENPQSTEIMRLGLEMFEKQQKRLQAASPRSLTRMPTRSIAAQRQFIYDPRMIQSIDRLGRRIYVVRDR